MSFVNFPLFTNVYKAFPKRVCYSLIQQNILNIVPNNFLNQTNHSIFLRLRISLFLMIALKTPEIDLFPFKYLWFK